VIEAFFILPWEEDSMERMDTMIRWGAAVFGGLTSFLFGGWSSLLTALAFFVLVDYFSGVLSAWKAGELSSRVGFWGGVKKVGIFAVIAIAHHLDQALGQYLGAPHVLRDGATWFYLANEALSILENLGRLGVPIPPIVRRGVKVLREKTGQ